MSMQQLAGWVRERRAQLELTQEEVATLGPLSDKTVRTVESGRATGLRRNTRSALERALQWQAGSVKDAIDHGLKPQPIADKPRASKRRTEVKEEPPQAIPATPPIAPAGETGLGGDGLASAGASFAVARAALRLRNAVGLMRDTMAPSELEAALADLVETQREAEIALSQAMQWIVNDDAKRREAGQLLYELQQPF